VNVDGYVYIDTRREFDEEAYLWNKNRGSTGKFEHGVECIDIYLNRNFGFKFGIDRKFNLLDYFRELKTNYSVLSYLSNYTQLTKPNL